MEILNNVVEKKICGLDKLKVGQRAKILQIKSEDKLICRRMFDMGLTKGVVVRVKKQAPLGDPIGLEIRGYELCLRKDELKNILVEVVLWGWR